MASPGQRLRFDVRPECPLHRLYAVHFGHDDQRAPGCDFVFVRRIVERLAVGGVHRQYKEIRVLTRIEFVDRLSCKR